MDEWTVGPVWAGGWMGGREWAGGWRPWSMGAWAPTTHQSWWKRRPQSDSPARALVPPPRREGMRPSTVVVTEWGRLPLAAKTTTTTTTTTVKTTTVKTTTVKTTTVTTIR